MEKILELKNVNLASINKKYGGRNKHTGRFFLSQDYKTTMQMIYFSLKKIKVQPPIKLVIFVESYKDIDNIIHAIVNTIQKKEIIKNDRDIDSLKVYKKVIKKGSLDNLHVFIGTSKLDYDLQLAYYNREM